MCHRGYRIGEILVGALIVLLVISGFSSMVSAQQTTNLKANSTSTLVVAIKSDIGNLNLFDPNTNTVWKKDVLKWCFESLLSNTPNDTPYLLLAQSYTVDTPDGLNVTVYLKYNAHFQDGIPVTAKDVVFSFQTLYWDPLYQTSLKCLYWSIPKWSRWDGNGTSHIGVVADPYNPFEVHFHLSRPYPLFYQLTLTIPILPVHIWNSHIVSASTGDSNDAAIDTSWSDPNATIGTGAFKFVEWQKNSYIIIDRDDNYWGKNLEIYWNGKYWNPFPQNITEIKFVIYPTTDAAVYALKIGKIDFIDWSIPSEIYKELKNIPVIGSQVVDDQGFFYLAFNMRKAPMNDLAFRTAVAHAINKDYIVTTLMQGYGIKGTVPISITSGAYVNTSAIPPDFDLDAARQVLANAGYKDVNGDGWLEAPDGSPIKETILTPPKDYDPVRAEAGIMMQTNLQKIGLNIQSSPTAFDTIVSKVFVQVNFDMYVLGWGVGSFPETYLYDFFHSSQKAPIGYNTPGYSNPKVDKLLDEIEVEMDTAKRIQMVKDVEGILVHDLPYDTLYYRKNIMCYRKDVWQGWVPAFGTIFNIFSFSQLYTPQLDTSDAYTSSDTLSGLITTITVPSIVYSPENISGYVYSREPNGYPVGNVIVALSFDGFNYTKVVTNYLGIAEFNINLNPMENKSVINLTYVSYIKQPDGTMLFSNGTVPITIVPINNIIQLNYWADRSMLTPGEKTVVHILAHDRFGNPISGLRISARTEYGNLSWNENITNSNGSTQLIYTAPENNMTGSTVMDCIHISYNASGKNVLHSTGTGVIPITIISLNHSRWYIVKIINITRFGISAGESTNITVKVVDENGNAIANKTVNIEAIYSNATDPYWYGEVAHVDTQNISFDATQKTTDANGEAVFTMTAINNTNKPYIIKAYVNSPYSVYDAAEIYVGNVTPLITVTNNHTYVYNTTTGNITWTNTTQESSKHIGSDPWIGAWTVPYGLIMKVDVTSTSYGQTVSVSMNVYYAMNVTVQTVDIVYNASSNTTVSENVTTNITHYAGDPASGVISFLAVFGTDYGFGADWTSGGTYVWWAGQSFIVGTTDANGTFKSTLLTKPISSDQAIYISGWVDAYGYGTSSIWTGLGFQLPYLFGAKTGFLLCRGLALNVSVSLSSEYLTIDKNYTTMTVHVYSEGTPQKPVVNATVNIEIKYGDTTVTRSVNTDINGAAIIKIDVNSTYPYLTPVFIKMGVNSDDHVYYGMIPITTIGWLPNVNTTTEQNNIAIKELNVVSDTGSLYVVGDGYARITMRLFKGIPGNPLSGVKIAVISANGSVYPINNYTDSQGYASFIYVPPNAPYTSGARYYNVTFAIYYNNTTILQRVEIAVFSTVVPEFSTTPLLLLVIFIFAVPLIRRNKT